MIVVQPRSLSGWIARDRRRGVAALASKKKNKSKLNKPKSKSKTHINPVLETAEFAYKATNLVQINTEGVKTAARYIKTKLAVDSYTPCTWRTHPLHITPDDSVDVSHPKNKRVLDWIFLISALNFSFWSEKTSKDQVYAVQWRSAWEDAGEQGSVVWTGYWSLVAALDRAIADDNIPITDPNFYASSITCPDSLIEHVFRSAEPKDRREPLPLMKERIKMMRGVGKRLSDDFNGSFLHFIESFHHKFGNKGTALDLVKMVTDTFPEFRDECVIDGRKVYLWKRAQILVAETWAAFHPPSSTSLPHPIFPHGSQIHLLTMFADYRVPQILHHLRILSYPPALLDILNKEKNLPSGCREEVSLRTASIVAVERVRREMVRMEREETGGSGEEISSVLIDFYLWDLAKRIEDGEDKVDGIQTAEMAPTHRTRCVWY